MNKFLQVLGGIILLTGIGLLAHSQINMETSVLSDFDTSNVDQISSVPERISNIGLIADKINFTLLGGILTIVGLQLSLLPDQPKTRK